MGGTSLSVGLPLGAVLLGIWLDIRLETRRPRSLNGCTIRTPGRWMPDPRSRVPRTRRRRGSLEKRRSRITRVLALLNAAHMSKPVLLVGLFALFVPALAYACVTGLWLLRTLVDVARLVR